MARGVGGLIVREGAAHIEPAVYRIIGPAVRHIAEAGAHIRPAVSIELGDVIDSGRLVVRIGEIPAGNDRVAGVRGRKVHVAVDELGEVESALDVRCVGVPHGIPVCTVPPPHGLRIDAPDICEIPARINAVRRSPDAVRVCELTDASIHLKPIGAVRPGHPGAIRPSNVRKRPRRIQPATEIIHAVNGVLRPFGRGLPRHEFFGCRLPAIRRYMVPDLSAERRTCPTQHCRQQNPDFPTIGKKALKSSNDWKNRSNRPGMTAPFLSARRHKRFHTVHFTPLWLHNPPSPPLHCGQTVYIYFCDFPAQIHCE